MKKLYLLSCGVLLLVVLFIPKPIFAQFNGNYAIEKHYLDNENFFDWKAYQFPFSWKYRWYFTKNGLKATTGSISQERFYLLHEIRLKKEIGADFSIAYQQTEDDFYQYNGIYQEAEFSYGKDLVISILGFPAHHKKFGNLGYAVSYGERYSSTYIRYAQLHQMLLYNEKSKDDELVAVTDEISQTPILDWIEIQWAEPEGLFLHLEMKKERPSVLKIFSENTEKHYKGFQTSLILDYRSMDGWTLGMSGKRDSERRKSLPENSIKENPDLTQGLDHQWKEAYFHYPFDVDNRLTLGVLDSLLRNQIDSSFENSKYYFKMTTTQAYARFESRQNQLATWIYSLQYGYPSLIKDYPAHDTNMVETTLQIKAGLGIVLEKEDDFMLFCNSTWDLDIFAYKQWDGGNLQLIMEF